MSYVDNCHYHEFRTGNGWRWRLELRPASSAWKHNRADGDGAWATWSKLQDNVFLPESVDEVSVGFDKLPIGLSGPVTMKLKFNTAHASDDLFDVLYNRTAPAHAVFSLGPEEETVSWRISNTWVLRTDFGDGEDYSADSIDESSRALVGGDIPGQLAYAPLYFVGAQRMVRSPATTISLTKQTAEVVAEHLVYSAMKSLSVFDYGKRLLHEVFVENDPFVYKRTVHAYEYAFQNAGTKYLLNGYFGVTGTAIMISLLVLNNKMREYLNEILGWYRVQYGPASGDVFANEHIKMFRQNYLANGEPGSEIPANEDSRYVMACTSDKVAGLLIPGTSRSAGFEGETALDAAENFIVSTGAKGIWQTTGSVVGFISLQTKPALQTVRDAQEVDAEKEFIGDYELTLGEYVMRSCAFNIDTSNSDDNDEYRFFVGGGQNAEDFEAKMILHNLPSSRQLYDNDTNNDVSGSAFKKFTGIRDFRKFYYRDRPDWFDSPLFDPVFRVHDYIEYYDGIDWWGAPAAPTVLTSDFNAASKQIQRVSGMPNIIARAIATRFSSDNQCKLKAKVGLQKFSPDHVGSAYAITLPGRFSPYSGTYWLCKLTAKISKSLAEVELIKVG